MASRRAKDEERTYVAPAGGGDYTPAYMSESPVVHDEPKPMSPSLPPSKSHTSRSVHRGASRGSRGMGARPGPRHSSPRDVSPVAAGCVRVYVEENMDLCAVGCYLNGKRVDEDQLFVDLRSEGYPQIVQFIQNEVKSTRCG